MNTIFAKNIPTKNTNNVWAVYMEGEEENLSYCKSAYKAMRLMFLIKAQTGFTIDDDSLKALVQANAQYKAEHPLTQEQVEAKEKIEAAAEQIAEEHSVDAVLAEKPKKVRKPRTRKPKACASESKVSTCTDSAERSQGSTDVTVAEEAA